MSAAVAVTLNAKPQRSGEAGSSDENASQTNLTRVCLVAFFSLSFLSLLTLHPSFWGDFTVLSPPPRSMHTTRALPCYTGHPRLFPRRRVPVPAVAHHHGLRLRGCRRDVPRHDLAVPGTEQHHHRTVPYRTVWWYKKCGYDGVIPVHIGVPPSGCWFPWGKSTTQHSSSDGPQ